MRLFHAVAVFCLAAVSTAADRDPVAAAAARLDTDAGRTPASLGVEFRLLGAQALQKEHPDLAARFTRQALDQLRAAKDPPGSVVVRMLAAADPAGAAALVKAKAPALLPDLIAALARQKSPAAIPLYRESVAGRQAAGIKPDDALSMISLAAAMAPLAPDAAAESLEQVLTAASEPGFGDGETLSATFQSGQQTISTSNPRDTVLVAAGSRLLAIAPAKAGKFREALSRWNLQEPVQMRSINRGTASSQPATRFRRSTPAATAHRSIPRHGQR